MIEQEVERGIGRVGAEAVFARGGALPILRRTADLEEFSRSCGAVPILPGGFLALWQMQGEGAPLAVFTFEGDLPAQ